MSDFFIFPPPFFLFTFITPCLHLLPLVYIYIHYQNCLHSLPQLFTFTITLVYICYHHCLHSLPQLYTFTPTISLFTFSTTTLVYIYYHPCCEHLLSRCLFVIYPLFTILTHMFTTITTCLQFQFVYIFPLVY